MAISIKSKVKVHYISYGITKTGGYRHEKFLYKEAIRYFRKRQEVKGYFFRKYKLFKHFLAYLQLLVWSFLKSGGTINIVTARTGVSAMFRNWFNRNEVWIVLHNFDENDGKSELLRWYYKKLFNILKNAKHNRFKIVTVSSFFVKYFKEEAGIKNTFLFPNLFDIDFYKAFQSDEKSKWVHLGQYSRKNDPAIFTLANRLTDAGYFCYFSTLNKKDIHHQHSGYEIIYFSNFADYLTQLSKSYCTLSLTAINEGWPRIAHESILVGTPVIGYANGGLADLLLESNSHIVKNIDEAFICIEKGNFNTPSSAFIEKYNVLTAEKYIDQLCKGH